MAYVHRILIALAPYPINLVSGCIKFWRPYSIEPQFHPVMLRCCHPETNSEVRLHVPQ